MQDAVSKPGPAANALVHVTNPSADASRGTQSKTGVWSGVEMNNVVEG
jgi:hypothetical protein